MVSAPARDHAGAELLAAQPTRPVVANLRMHALLGVEDIRRGTQPHCIVQVLRDRHFRLFVAGWIARKTDFHRLQLTNPSIAHQLGGVTELRRGALLAAELQDSSGTLHRVAQGPAFGNGERSWFLDRKSTRLNS